MDQSDQELIEKLTKAIHHTYEKPHRTYIRSFGFGIAYGLGASIGVALVLAALSYALHILGGIPVVGDWLTGIGNNLPQK